MLKKNILKNQAFALSLFALFMLGMSFAAVPLYKLFCQVTGYGGTPLISNEKNLVKTDKKIDIRFDSSVEKNSPLYFEPEKKKVSVNIGENSLAFYKAVNNTDRKLTTMSVFNVTPHHAAKYFNKIECFCFEEQVLNPGENVDMPVSFFIDPTIKDDKFINNLEEIALSYTMFVR